jgi:class 3 adenylate cyclase
VTERGDLFGASVQFAARLCDSAEARCICVTEAVREIAMGKRFQFGAVEELDVKSFEAPVRVASLLWQETARAGWWLPLEVVREATKILVPLF